MAIDFPNSPATNDTFTSGNRTWVYDGEKWNISVVSTSSVLDALSDVTITSASGYHVLQYDDVSSAWVNSANLTVFGRLDVQELRETVVDSSISSNVMTCDYTTGNIFYQTTAPGANFTVNLTNVPTDNGYSVTVSIFVTQGSTGYIPNALQIAGASQTIKWANGTTPTPTSSSGKVDVFTFTCVRHSSTWTVFGNASVNY